MGQVLNFLKSEITNMKLKFYLLIKFEIEINFQIEVEISFKHHKQTPISNKKNLNLSFKLHNQTPPKRIIFSRLKSIVWILNFKKINVLLEEVDLDYNKFDEFNL